MSRWVREVGDVRFIRITSGSETPRVEVVAHDVTVRILKDKRVFTATEFAAFCTEENAKRIVKEYIKPLLRYLEQRKADVFNEASA